MLEQDLVTWLSEITALPAHYQHLDSKPARAFVWFIRNGDDDLDTLDGSGEPDVVYFDLEIYDQTPVSVQSLAQVIRSYRDYRGELGDGAVDDIAFEDQRDDYESQASADTLPPYTAAFRLIVSGYEAG
jgi:hypothetical protein